MRQDATRFEREFAPPAAKATALAIFFVGLPIAAVNFLDGRAGFGWAALAMISMVAVHAWMVTYHPERSGITLVMLIGLGIALLAAILLAREVLGLLWCYPAILLFYCVLPERGAWLVNAFTLALILPIAANLLEHEVLLRAVATLVTVSFFAATLARVVHRQRERLQTLAATDPLTGLLNRRSLGRELQSSIVNVRTEKLPMSLLAIDLDHFNRVNDRFGHPAGDEVLRRTGGFLRGAIRADDVAWRIGGEEFMVLLRDADEAEAKRIAQSLLEHFRSRFRNDDSSLSISIGLATLETDDDVDRWMRRADEALYLAKSSGRDRLAFLPSCEVSLAESHAVSRFSGEPTLRTAVEDRQDT